MKPEPEWNPAPLLQSLLFAPLHPALACLQGQDFPTLQDCNALLASRKVPIVVQADLLLRFVAQAQGKLPFAAQYEPRCYLKGEVQMRDKAWHDLLNALVWLTFPKSKAALNARHYQALISAAEGNLSNQRGAVRDMATLFDESGVVIVCAEAELSNLLRDFLWKELFWRRREQVCAAMGFYVFGHGLYEKALQPYMGMTGQGLLLVVEQEFFTWPLVRRLAHIDKRVADYLNASEHCCSTRELAPVPLLGVPGWAAENAAESYYDNTAYFRSGRQRTLR